jgi:hypothetical protein
MAKENLQMLTTHIISFQNICYMQLVEPMNVESMCMEGPLYHV